MSTETPLLLALDFTGTLVFALNGALTAVRAERLDIFGVITLGMFTGLGGGVIRDVLLDALPPATFLDWRYLALAAGGGLIAFILSRRLERLAMAITVLDAVGLSVFAVLGADKALSLGFGVVQALIVGTLQAAGSPASAAAIACTRAWWMAWAMASPCAPRARAACATGAVGIAEAASKALASSARLG